MTAKLLIVKMKEMLGSIATVVVFAEPKAVVAVGTVASEG